MKYKKYYWVVFIVVLIDQISKMLVYQYMDLGYMGEIKILGLDWARLHYILNEGMAFGIKVVPKAILSIFRLLAISALLYFFYLQIKEKAHRGFLFCLALILGGAIGNAIDSVFYGVLLEGNVMEHAPTPWLYGQVIDMFYFPMFEGSFPSWMPFFGGDRFLFFSAIFNVADSAIFMGAVSLLLFNRKFFKEEAAAVETQNGQDNEVADSISDKNTSDESHVENNILETPTAEEKPE